MDKRWDMFNPAMLPGGALTESLGWLFGTGPGRGMGGMLCLVGLIPVLATGLAYLYPRLRFLEDEIEDVLPESSRA